MTITLPPPQPQITYAILATDLSHFCDFSITGFEKGTCMRVGVDCEILDPDMLQYLTDRAISLGLSFNEVYREELDAKADLAVNTPSNSELLRIARTSGPPPGFLNDLEERPW